MLFLINGADGLKENRRSLIFSKIFKVLLL